MRTKRYRVGELCFEISYSEGVHAPDNFALFEEEDATPEYFYVLEQVEELPVREDRQPDIVFEDLVVFRTEIGEDRLLGVQDMEHYYGYSVEVDEKHTHAYIRSGDTLGLRYDPVFLSLLALERRMTVQDSLIFHCAYIRRDSQAILFSADSGVGKSTQADLWAKYRGTTVLNGDKSLLRKVDGAWTACGWPACGTSEICNNVDTPIGTIVMLEQAKENHIRRLSPMEAFRKIYPQITVNRWDAEQTERVLSLVSDLVSGIPVYLLGCDISEDAVRCLESILQ